MFDRCQEFKKESATDLIHAGKKGWPAGKKGEWKAKVFAEKSGAAVPLCLHAALADVWGRVIGKGSASINSCYITSLCWCQVVERKERRGSAMTLFFSVVRPRPAPLRLIPLRVCRHRYRQALRLPSAVGGLLVPLLRLPLQQSTLTTMSLLHILRQTSRCVLPFKSYWNKDDTLIRWSELFWICVAPSNADVW